MRNDDSVIKNACCKQVAFRAADLLSSYVYGYIDSRNTTVFRFDENLFYCMAKRGVPELIAQAITEYNEYMWSTHEDEDFYQWLKDYEKYAKNKVFLHSMIKNAESYCEHDYDNRKTLYDPDGFEIYEKINYINFIMGGTLLKYCSDKESFSGKALSRVTFDFYERIYYVLRHVDEFDLENI